MIFGSGTFVPDLFCHPRTPNLEITVSCFFGKDVILYRKSEVIGVKSRTWAVLIGIILIVCLALSALLLLPGEDAAYAQVWSEGKLLHTLDLSVDRVVTVSTATGTNVITVKDGRIAVTEADCPDGYCMDRGFCAGGLQIVCLPNKLEIRFTQQGDIDGIAR